MRIDSLAKFELWALEYYPIYQEALAKYGQPTELSFWLHREYIRSRNGTYDEFHITLKRFQFVHPSVDDPRQVAYTPNMAYGIADRQLRIRPGKFYQKFSGLKDTNAIKDFVAKWNITYVPDDNFGFTNNEDMIREVYLNNACSSCMTTGVWADREDTPVAEFWADNEEVMLAYSKHPRRDVYTGRAWVNINSKKYVRVYDSSTELEEWLQSQGFRQSSYALKGVCANPRARWLPYLDGCANVVCHNCGYITDDADEECPECGEYELCVADGQYGEWVEYQRMVCDRCSDRMHEDDAIYMDNYDQHICEHCSNNYVLETYTGSLLYEEDTVESIEGHILDNDDPSSTGCHVFVEHAGGWAHQDNCYHSTLLDEYIYEDDAVQIVTEEGTDFVYDNYIDENTYSFYLIGGDLVYADDLQNLEEVCELNDLDPNDAVNLMTAFCDFLIRCHKVRDDGPNGEGPRRCYSVHFTSIAEEHPHLTQFTHAIYTVARRALQRVLVNYDEAGLETVTAEFIKWLENEKSTIQSYDDYLKEKAA